MSRILLHKKFPYFELFWYAFPHIRTEYVEILRTYPYSVRMRENVDQNNAEYEPFSRSIFHNNLKAKSGKMTGELLIILII